MSRSLATQLLLTPCGVPVGFGSGSRVSPGLGGQDSESFGGASEATGWAKPLQSSIRPRLAEVSGL